MTEDEAWFIYLFRQAVERDGIMIDCSGMNGAMSYDLHFAAVDDGRLEHVDEVIDGIQQVPFFRITNKGRAWLAEVDR